MDGVLSLRDAAARYGVPRSTLSHWVGDGLIRVAKRGSAGQRVWLVEADVEAAARLYVPGKGKFRRARLAAALVSSTR